MKKAYATENGVPRSVATTEALPNRGFIGATIFCEDDQNLYVYTGNQYITVGGGASNPAGESAPSVADVRLPVVDKVASLSTDAPQGALAFVESTTAVYCKVGSNWKKLAFTDDSNN